MRKNLPLAILDSGISSLSNVIPLLIVNIKMSGDDAGRYSFLLNAVVISIAILQARHSEPLMIMNNQQLLGGHIERFAPHVIRDVVFLGLISGIYIFFATGNKELGAIAVFSTSIISFLDWLRYVNIKFEKIGIVLIADSVWLISSVVGFLYFSNLSASSAMITWTLFGAISQIILLSIFFPKVEKSTALLSDAQESSASSLSSYGRNGRALSIEVIIGAAVSVLTSLIISSNLGLAAFAIFRLTSSLFGGLNVAINAGRILGLSESLVRFRNQKMSFHKFELKVVFTVVLYGGALAFLVYILAYLNLNFAFKFPSLDIVLAGTSERVFVALAMVTTVVSRRSGRVFSTVVVRSVLMILIAIVTLFVFKIFPTLIALYFVSAMGYLLIWLTLRLLLKRNS